MVELYILGVSSSGTPKIDISSATITLGASLTYSGSEQTQSVTSVVVNGTTLVENTDYAVTDNTGINAGDYTLSVVGMGNYTGTATQAWSIAKANGSVSLSPTSLSLDTSNLTGTIEVTRSGDGAITAQSSNTSIATVEVSGTSVTVTAVANGSATVTVNVAAGTNHLATSETASVNVTLISSTLADNEPSTIRAVARAGTGTQYWSVGDVTAPITISTVSTLYYFTPPTEGVCAFIIGFNHNSSVEGTGIHFQFGKTMSGTNIALIDRFYGSNTTSKTVFNMNAEDADSTGWSGSRMKTVVCPAFKSALPSKWRSVIKGCKKWTDNIGEGGGHIDSNVTETTEEIFLLAEYEVFGAQFYANKAEQNKQQQYAYYANGNSKIKYKHDSTGTTCIWWLRSPYYAFSDMFVYVSANGGAGNGGSPMPRGFAPGFMVG